MAGRARNCVAWRFDRLFGIGMITDFLRRYCDFSSGELVVFAMFSTILVVDDDEALTPLLRQAIQKAGLDMKLEQVSSGEEAVRYLSREGDFGDDKRFPFPSVMLLDLRMPGRDGFWVLEWKRNQPELNSLPVAIWSVSNRPEDKERALAMGASAYFEKPMEREEFARIVHTLAGLNKKSAA